MRLQVSSASAANPNPSLSPNQVGSAAHELDVSGKLDKAHISPISPLYLPCISPISPLYRAYISPISPLYRASSTRRVLHLALALALLLALALAPAVPLALPLPLPSP